MNILAAPTPAAWVDAACEHWRELLIDHANCEKKAASSALALIFAYPEDQELSSALSRLAREELRHFEQVSQLMRRLHMSFERQRPGRYAAGLRAALRRHEPARKLDLMLADRGTLLRALRAAGAAPAGADRRFLRQSAAGRSAPFRAVSAPCAPCRWSWRSGARPLATDGARRGGSRADHGER